jgi:hypothetical protein
MKRYHLEVITGDDFCVDYTVDAETFEIIASGCYIFYIRDDKQNLKTVASYPINRTIIKRIEEL